MLPTRYRKCGYPFAASLRFSAQRRLVAAIIAFLPAAESFRLALGASADDATGADFAFDSAHLLRCASAIRFRPAALIFRRFEFGTAGVGPLGIAAPTIRREVPESGYRCAASALRIRESRR